MSWLKTLIRICFVVWAVGCEMISSGSREIIENYWYHGWGLEFYYFLPSWLSLHLQKLVVETSMLLKSVLGILYSVQFILAVKGNGVHSLRPAFCRLVCPLRVRVCLVLRLLLWLWFEKNYFIKSTFSWGWFEKIYVWLTLWLNLRLKKK
jgi:hypothetical protein